MAFFNLPLIKYDFNGNIIKNWIGVINIKLAIFDFDGTLFTKDTLPFLLSEWKKQKYSKIKLIKIFLPLIPLYIIYKLGLNSKLTREEMKLTAFKKCHHLFDGLSEDEILGYFENCSKSIVNLFNEQVVTEINQAKEKGYHTVLLSGSYTSLLNLVADYLKIDSVIGTEIPYKNGFIDSCKDLDITSGTLKINRLLNHFKNESIEWEQSSAFADSFSDIHILKLVGNPVAVNPDNKLKEIAVNTNWRII